MNRFLLITAFLVLPGIASAQPIHEICPPGVNLIEQGGCLLVGSGQGGVAFPVCAYEALDESQDVVVLTPNAWQVTVERLCPEKPFLCEWEFEDGGCYPTEESSQGECAPIRDEETDEIVLQCTSVVLASGVAGPPALPTTVEPEVGEVVRVSMDILIAGPASGTWGAIGVGLEDQQ